MNRPLFSSRVPGVAFTVAILALACQASEPPEATITLFPETSLGSVSSYVFGAGIDHKTNPMRFCRYPEKVARDVAESGLRIARYPGGFVFARDDHRRSWKNFYWQDHIGKNPDGKPFDTYDLDTFVQMCERFSIEPLMQINFVGEPLASVRGYIEYLVGDGDIDGDGVDWAAKRVANGRREPYRIRYWQLGNEVHSYPQGFRENAAGAKAYAEALNQLVPVIRGMAPDARIVAPFINIERPLSGMKALDVNAGPDINFTTSAEFTHAFLQHVQVDIDFFDWHFYPANGWHGNYPFLGTDNEWKHYYGWGTKFRECYAVIVDLMQQHCSQRPLPRLIVGEWSGDWTGAIFRNAENSYRGSMMRTMASAVYMADILLFMMTKSTPPEHLHAAFWHNFANGAQELFSIQTTPEYERVLGAGRTWKGRITDEGYGVRMPVYWVFKLLSEHHGEILIESHLAAPENRIAAPQNGLYTDPEYAFDRVTHCATRTGDVLYLAILNKDAHLSVDLRTTIRGWKLQPDALAYTVGAESYLVENSMQHPDRVTLSGPRSLPLRNAHDVHLRLPPNTLKVVRFRKQTP